MKRLEGFEAVSLELGDFQDTVLTHLKCQVQREIDHGGDEEGH